MHTCFILVIIATLVTSSAGAASVDWPTLTPSSYPILHSRPTDARLLDRPPCAVPCVEQFCTPSNQTCTCGPYKEAIDRCIVASCGIPTATYLRNSTEIACGTPVRNRGVNSIIMTVSVTLVTILVTMARMLYMQFFSARRHPNPEEWCIIVAATIGLPSACINVFALVPSGMSKDVWGLHPAGLVATARYFFIVSITYVVLMMLVKLSLTFFYLSIFTGRIRYLLWATIAFHVVTATTYLLGVVFQCIPTAYTWEKFNFASTNPVQGHCLDLNTAGWANSAVSVAADLWLLSLPLSQVHKLRLTWKKKVGAALMFMTGTIVTVVSCLRLASIRRYASTSNPTWDQLDIFWWSTVELGVGIICTCMPTLRLILIRIAPRVFGSDPSNVLITLNHIESKNTENTRHEDGDNVAVQSRCSQDFVAPPTASPAAIPRRPEAALYNWRNASKTDDSIGSLEYRDTWHDTMALVRKPSNWRCTI